MQWLIVTLVVLAALARVVWHYLPARWRSPLAARLGLRAGAASAGGCAGCAGCPRSSACGADQPAEAEIRVRAAEQRLAAPRRKPDAAD